MPLRVYQEKLRQLIWAAWDENPRCKVVGVMPTGAGKTETACAILESAKRPVAIVHTTTLEDQSARRLPSNVGVTTIQALTEEGSKADHLRWQVENADMVWFDECHHYASDKWSEGLRVFKNPDVRVFGMTATPIRADKKPLSDVWDKLIATVNYSDLLELGYLVHCDVWASDISRKNQKKFKVKPDGVKAYLERGGLRSDGSPRPAIHFENTVKDSEKAVAAYALAGLRACVITAKTAPTMRRYRFAQFENGELDVLVSPSVLAEGFDSPRAEVCVMARSGDGLGDFLQRVGRVLRPYTQEHIAKALADPFRQLTTLALIPKERALLIDCTNATEKHGVPTDDRVYSLERGIELLADVEAAEAEEEETKRKEAIRVDFERVASEYRLVTNELLTKWRKYYAREVNNGLTKGTARRDFNLATGLVLPMHFLSKYSSKCVECRKRIPEQGPMFWVPANPKTATPAQCYHEACFFEAIDHDQLDEYRGKVHHTEQTKATPVAELPFSWRAFDHDQVSE